jgi:hypothetical protein
MPGAAGFGGELWLRIGTTIAHSSMQTVRFGIVKRHICPAATRHWAF